MERQINFLRDRHFMCGSCGHQWIVDLEWIDRWSQGAEMCPSCGLTNEHENAPRVTVDSCDLALDEDNIAHLFWYHTSTHPGWPAKDFDPAAGLTAETRRVMGGDQRVAAWGARQRAKALHVGTYEAAIHNMLRRIDDQADHGNQFYLYRVRLKPSVVVREDWLTDPSDFVGDVALADVCPPGIDAARYLNYHEDPGGISLALGLEAIADVQGIAVPLAGAWDADWVRDAVGALAAAKEPNEPPVPPSGELRRFRLSTRTPRVRTARTLADDLSSRLPINLQDQFTAAAEFADDADPAQWARQVSGLLDLVENPVHALAALDTQERRQV